MKRYLAFFAVSNSCGYDRHSFDLIDKQTEGQQIADMIDKLPEDEKHVYDLDHYGYGGEPAPNIIDLETDYNDEALDGGMWTVYFELPD